MPNQIDQISQQPLALAINESEFTPQRFVSIMSKNGVEVIARKNGDGKVIGASLSIQTDSSASVWRRQDVQAALKWSAGTYNSNAAIGAVACNHVAAELQSSNNLT